MILLRKHWQRSCYDLCQCFLCNNLLPFIFYLLPNYTLPR
ncbi:hypothetical protein HMPREF9078_02274 [Capnocytophaga sp. oral taxon 380 str. F0488]|nr:hypothetical protein HMPREF9078_02274 [Capnocytophaga sp. oral taxon 380 str. F0488]